jgi:3-oxoacyl-[acyl-carrier protein] reductase
MSAFLSLVGQTAVVTGASRGLGYSMALQLARQGAAIHVVARGLEGAQAAAKNIAAETGVMAYAHAADIGDGPAVLAVSEAIQKLTPTVEILVNNAGITRDGLLMRMKDEDFDEVLRVNLKSVFLLSRAFMRAMLKQRYGRIVNITSIVGVHGQAGQANYAASKAGIIGFTKSYAKEVATRNITCNAVAPGFIESDMTGTLNEAQKAGILAGIPSGRMGKPEEVAAMVAYLCSKEAAYVTGQVFSIDGGMGI